MAEETITAQTPEIDPGMSVMPEGPGLMDVPTVIPELGYTANTLASAVSFAKKTWRDGSGGGTPITAAELNRLEQGVADLTAAVNGLRDSVSRLSFDGITGVEFVNALRSGYPGIAFQISDGKTYLLYTTADGLVLYDRNDAQAIGSIQWNKA